MTDTNVLFGIPGILFALAFIAGFLFGVFLMFITKER